MRIGPCMEHVRRLAGLSPEGISRAEAARIVGPHGSTCYGYASVNRAIEAGIVEAYRPAGSRGVWVRLPATAEVAP